MAQQMKALVMDRFGGPEVLRIETLERPAAGPGEVLIEIASASVNPADWKTREGKLSKYINYHFPFVLGFDLCGKVVATGPGANRFAVGDFVFGTSQQGVGRNGSYAEFATAYEATLQPLPQGVSTRLAAALPTAGITAFGGLVDVGDIKAGQTVLINGGAGGVGSIAIQIAKAVGASVAATCRAINFDYVQALGCDLPLDYTQDDVADKLRAWAPAGVDLVLDAVGMGSLLPKAAGLVRRGGRYVEIETLISEASEADRAEACQNGFEIMSNMTAIERLPNHLEGLAALLKQGLIASPDIEVVSLAEVPSAHARIEKGHVRGKIVVSLNPMLEGVE